MKLRNKKTGEVQDSEKLFSCYESLKELSEYWEDYTQSEPLIKDEKIRKAVRAWADINGIDKKVEYNTYISDGSCSFVFTYDGGGAELLLDFRFLIDTLKGGKYYTIAELCGEEEA